MTSEDPFNIDDKNKSYEEYMHRIGKENIPVYTPILGKEEIDNLINVINSNWISEGKYTREFENSLSELCQRDYALAFSSATAALITGMKSFSIGHGDEVIVPSFSHSADPGAISATGASPVFVDVDKDTMCLTTKTIENAVTSKTKAVLFVCAYGNVSDIELIENYCKSNNLIFINDCAPALCGNFRGRSIASYGDFSVLSFFADKTITTGEGGMLLTNDSDLISEANIFKHDGRKERGHDLIERRGYNFRITEFQSAVGVAQLTKVNSFVHRKKEILETYRTLLTGSDKVKVFKFNPEGDIVPHRIILFVKCANTLIKQLTSLGIGSRTLFSPMHLQPCYAVHKKFEVTEQLFEEGLELPSSPSITSEDIQFITSSIKEFVQ